MKQLAILCFIVIGSITSSYGQNSEPVDGTYQLIIHDTGKKELVFTTDFIKDLNIESLRKYDSDTTIVVNSVISVYIPSRQKIEADDFIKLELKKYE